MSQRFATACALWIQVSMATTLFEILVELAFVFVSCLAVARRSVCILWEYVSYEPWLLYFICSEVSTCFSQ